ncbi:MAG: TolC family protein [Deltaproteobacteria bacterium]|nr:TolC family protein [Deltaproteobacteria bacterium]
MIPPGVRSLVGLLVPTAGVLLTPGLVLAERAASTPAPAEGLTTAGSRNAAPDPAAPGPVGALADPKRLALESVIARFLSADPQLRGVRVEQAIAALDLAASRDRFRVYATASPGVAGDFRFKPNHDAIVLGDLPLGGVIADDPLGGTAAAKINLHGVSDPRGYPPGHVVAAELSYALPLLRNRFGRLYELEEQVFRDIVEARGLQLQAATIERCAAALELFAGARTLQEQLTVYDELLETRDKTYKRTIADYNKKLVQKLDYLAAKADFLAATQRREELAAAKAQAIAVLATFLGEQSTFELEDHPALHHPPVDPGAAHPGVGAHPLVRVLDQEIESLEGRAALAARTYGPELFLIPRAGLNGASDLLVGTSTRRFLDAFVGITLGLTLPVVEPNADYQPRSWRHQAELLQSRRDEVVRALTERARLAAVASASIVKRLAHTDEKLSISQAQVAEARDLYQRGRLEFQDYFQHWAIFENARFERLELELELVHAWAVAFAARGDPPSFCGAGAAP